MPDSPLEIDDRTLETKVKSASENLYRGGFFNNVRYVSRDYSISPDVATFCHTMRREFGIAYALQEKARNHLGLSGNILNEEEDDLNIYLTNILAERITTKMSRFVKYEGTEKKANIDFGSKDIVTELIDKYCTEFNEQARENHLIEKEGDIFHVSLDFFTSLKNSTRVYQKAIDKISSELADLVLPDEKAIGMESGIGNGKGYAPDYRVTEIQEVRYSDLGGIDPQIKQAREIIEPYLLWPEKFREFNVDTPVGSIFYGEPGTGKTHLGRAIVYESGNLGIQVAFYYVSGPEFRQKFIGEGDKLIKNMYNDAYENRPALIFIDEADAVLQARGSVVGQYTTEQTTRFLTCLDGFSKKEGVITIFGTNQLELLDKAFIDRFSKGDIIYFPLPNLEAREAIFGIHLSKSYKLEPNIDRSALAKELAERSEGASGRRIFKIINDAGREAIALNQEQVLLSNIESKMEQFGYKND